MGSKVGKKSLLKISAAAVPYRKKSYHSMAVPIRLAVATVTCDGCLVSSAMVVILSLPCFAHLTCAMEATEQGPRQMHRDDAKCLKNRQIKQLAATWRRAHRRQR